MIKVRKPAQLVHNSLEKRFTSQAARKAKACTNKAESLKAAALCAKIQERENELKDLTPLPHKSQPEFILFTVWGISMPRKVLNYAFIIQIERRNIFLLATVHL